MKVHSRLFGIKLLTRPAKFFLPYLHVHIINHTKDEHLIAIVMKSGWSNILLSHILHSHIQMDWMNTVSFFADFMCSIGNQNAR